MAVMLHAWATVLPHRQPAGVQTRFEINYKLFEKLGLVSALWWAAPSMCGAPHVGARGGLGPNRTKKLEPYGGVN